MAEEQKAKLTRYGIPTDVRYPSGSRKWDRADERFDLARHPNEANRFGWVVEIDPFDPQSKPRKHTALGRFKHEGANVIVARDGRVVAYMGDDERFDYLYKFVSDKKFMPGKSSVARRHNLTLLESGTLYVAKIERDSPAAEIDGSGKLPADGGVRRPGPLDQAGQRQPLVRRRHDRRRRAHLHPAGRGQGRRDEDGPPRGRRAEPAHRQGVRGADEQQRPRQGGQGAGRRGEPAQQPTGTGRSWSWSRTAATTPPRPSPGRCRSSAATRPTPRPTSPGTTRPRSRRSPARTTSPSTPPATCGSRPTATRWAATTACSPPPSRVRSGAT